ncbi:MAG: hypothetical protein HN976_39315 [Lentisphaerae bacterium]|nr:hypothetical protein [Lentisphaerota bacterium]MBT7061203.1 hypothetical protein [Lentisphaerota bacterium]
MSKTKLMKTLHLMVHPTPRSAEKVEEYFKRWNRHLTEAAADPETALCVLSNSPPEMKTLLAESRRLFGDRCIADPDDWSDATKLLYADMVSQAFTCLNAHSPDNNLYGLWTAQYALRWAEGLKSELDRRGFSYSPSELRVVGFGGMWGGCLTKYVALMSHQLGVSKTPEIMPELCSAAGFPVNGEYLEKFELPHHVWAFLFKANTGVYFAQFMESLKPVCNPPKMVELTINKEDYFIHTGAFNAYFPPDDSRIKGDGQSIAFPVMDGYSVPNVTIFCRHDNYDVFGESVRNANVKLGTNPDIRIHRSMIPYQQAVSLNAYS